MFYLHLLFTDGHMETHLIKRFSDLSRTKSRHYYYEEVNDYPGKGTVVIRDVVDCFEVNMRNEVI